MDCDRAREALSAIMDREAPPGDGDADALEDHLAACATCVAWHTEAAHLDRLTRLQPAESPGPDLAGEVLARVRLRRTGRLRSPLRAALLVVALAQLGIGVVSLFDALGMHAGPTPSVHMDHETAAFNLAFGVAMLLVAVNSGRAATQLPVLASFVTVLGVASVVDLADGAVGWTRLATHAPVVVGLLLIAALRREPDARTGPPARVWRRFRTAATARDGRAEAGSPRPGRVREDPPPAARSDAA